MHDINLGDRAYNRPGSFEYRNKPMLGDSGVKGRRVDLIVVRRKSALTHLATCDT